MTEDQIRDVIAQWRAKAEGQGAIYASGLIDCADELERRLAEPPQPQEAPLRRFTKQEREPFYFDPDEPLGSPTP